MINTQFGYFDSYKWDTICHLCLSEKYQKESFSIIDAGLIKYGINGFSQSGNAFSYYCPDEYLGRNALLVHQLDAINRNLEKLIYYESQLSEKIQKLKIRSWYFITPEISFEKIKDFCINMEDKIRSGNSSIIDHANFSIKIRALEFLKPELNKFINETIPIKKRQSGTNDLMSNGLVSEIKDQLQNSGHEITDTEDQTEIIIQHYLDGFNLLENWRINYPFDFEKFLKIDSEMEKVITFNTNVKLFDKLNINKIHKLLENTFPFLEYSKVESLSNYILADYIIRQRNTQR